jgi:hypothetical protein
MDNSTTPAVVEKAPLEKVATIEKNGRKFEIYKHVINRGAGQGNIFFGPNFDTLTPEDAAALHGNDVFLENFRRDYRKTVMSIFKGAVEEAKLQGKESDTNAIKEIFNKFYVELSDRGETKGQLEERKEEMMADLMRLAKEVAKNPALITKFTELSGRIEQITDTIEKKSRASKADKEDATEEVAKAA